MAKAIGTLGTIDTLTIGGRVFTDITTLIQLGGYCNGTNGTTMRKPSGSSGYQVTSGKTLTIYAGKIVQVTATAAFVVLAQSDNDVGVNSATALTSPVYMYGANNQATFAGASVSSTASFETAFPVAATKYLTIPNIGAGASIFAFLYGYEA